MSEATEVLELKRTPDKRTTRDKNVDKMIEKGHLRGPVVGLLKLFPFDVKPSSEERDPVCAPFIPMDKLINRTLRHKSEPLDGLLQGEISRLDESILAAIRSRSS